MVEHYKTKKHEENCERLNMRLRAQHEENKFMDTPHKSNSQNSDSSFKSLKSDHNHEINF